MKKYIVTLLSVITPLLLFSCSSKKEMVHSKQQCPENGICRFEQHPNKSLIIRKDDIGALYHQMEDNAGKTVFHYFYERNKEEAYVDGHYMEELIFEIDNTVLESSFENQKPNQILFGVFCYCKGKAGYYALTDTVISFDKKHKKISVWINGDIIDDQVLTFFEIVIPQVK